MKFFDPKKKDEFPGQTQTPSPAPQSYQPSTPSYAPAESRTPSAPARSVTQTVIGSSVNVKGDIRSEENITVHGIVEGTIDTTHDVLVGPEGKVRATIRASNVTISGAVIGNVTATNKVDLLASGQLQGNIRAPKLSIAESALFKGSIDMSAPDAVSEKESAASK